MVRTRKSGCGIKSASKTAMNSSSVFSSASCKAPALNPCLLPRRRTSIRKCCSLEILHHLHLHGWWFIIRVIDMKILTLSMSYSSAMRAQAAMSL